MKVMHRLVTALLISTTLLCVPLALDGVLGASAPDPAPVPMWSSFRGNALRNGWAAGPAPVHGEVLWEVQLGGPVQSSPVLGGGALYIGSDDGRLYALSPSTGAELWNQSFGEYATVQSTPAFADGRLFVGTQNGSFSGLFALNATDGSLLWMIPDDCGIAASPALAGGRVYSCSLNGTVIAADAATGQVLWESPRGGEMWSSPAVDDQCLYGGTIRGELFALWASNGSLRWNLTLPESYTVYSTPCAVNGSVYVGMASYNELHGELLSLDPSSGAVKWRFSGSEGDYSSAAAAAGAVFAHVWNKTANGSFLVALPATDPDGDGVIAPQELLWRFQTMDFEGGSSPLVTDNLVVVGSSDGNLYALDRGTGAQVWNASVGGKIVGSAALFEKRIYIGSMSGRLVCLGSASELPGLKVRVEAERDVLPAGMVMRLNVVVTDETGNPAEGAYVKFAVSAGNLSQGGASTFPDGTQTVKYMAPPVKRPLRVTVSVSAAKGGYAPAESSFEFNVTEYRSAYTGVGSGSAFNLAKYSPYLAAIALLGALDAAVLVLLVRTGPKGRRGAPKGGGRDPT